MRQVWGFGTAAIDIRIRTAEYGELYKDKLLAQESVWLGGGSTANFLVQAARLGQSVGWLGKLGHDPLGIKIKTMLEDEAVNCENVIFDEKLISPFNLAVYAGENRRRVGGFLLPNSMDMINEDDIRVLTGILSEGDYVLVEVGELPINTCIEFCKAASEKGVKVILDVDLDPIKQCQASKNMLEQLFSYADFLMPNIEALVTLYPNGDPWEITAVLSKNNDCITVTTLGKEGAIYALQDGGVSLVKSISITPIDTVGAGDAFHGGFVAGICSGLDVEKAVMLGNICGAHNCLTFGAREGMLRKHELMHYETKLL